MNSIFLIVRLTTLRSHGDSEKVYSLAGIAPYDPTPYPFFLSMDDAEKFITENRLNAFALKVELFKSDS